MKTLYFATSNDDKFGEIKKLMPYVRQLKAELDEPRTDDIKKIAIEKAKQAYKIVKKPVFAEDTGLFIDALNGFPGTNTHWFHKKMGSLKGLLKLMEDIGDRSAKFITAVGYFDGKNAKVFLGEKSGRITTEERGRAGWGHDPIFIPRGYNKTYTELGPEIKNRISHRTIAIKKFLKWIENGK